MLIIAFKFSGMFFFLLSLLETNAKKRKKKLKPNTKKRKHISQSPLNKLKKQTQTIKQSSKKYEVEKKNLEKIKIIYFVFFVGEWLVLVNKDDNKSSESVCLWIICG